MVDASPTVHVHICYINGPEQILHEMVVRPGATLQEAILQSGILKQVPEIDLAVCAVGIYGKLKSRDTVLRDHDRIEIYRPLIADPKESRRKRANKKAT